MEKRFKTLKEFYPFYLTQHSNVVCRTFHFVGTFIAFILLFSAIFKQSWYLLFFVPFAGYGFSWMGHFFFEKNKPAAFKQPFYSLCSDFIMFFDLLFGRIPFNPLKNINN